jgi:hypothetical protein
MKTKPGAATPQKQATRAEPAPLQLVLDEGQDPVLEIAKLKGGPHLSGASVITRFARGSFGEVDINGAMASLKEASSKASAGRMEDVEATLVSQAAALNVMFAELARKAHGNMEAGYLSATETFLKLALRAQNQSRMTLETLANVKNPPVLFAKQANITTGPQQVNNGLAQPTALAGETQIAPNKLLEQSHEPRMDPGAKGAASGSDQAMAALDALDRADN